MKDFTNLKVGDKVWVVVGAGDVVEDLVAKVLSADGRFHCPYIRTSKGFIMSNPEKVGTTKAEALGYVRQTAHAELKRAEDVLKAARQAYRNALKAESFELLSNPIGQIGEDDGA